MAKSKLFNKRAFLIAGALAGCVAGGAVAATAPPTIPIAPAVPSKTYLYGGNWDGNYEIIAGQLGTNNSIVSPNISVSDFESFIFHTNAGSLISTPPIEINQTVTVENGVENYLSYPSNSYVYSSGGSIIGLSTNGSPYAFGDAYGELPNIDPVDNESPNGLFLLGNAGYGWLKIAPGGTLNTFGAGAGGGTFVGGNTNLSSSFHTPGYYYGGPQSGYGIVDVAGGIWNDANSALDVGLGSHGFVTVENGGRVTLTSAEGYIDVGGSGGYGTVVVKDGGVLQTSQSPGGYGSLIASGTSVGNGSGRVFVTGSGSLWSSGSYIEMGSGGTASLVVSDGGQVTSSGAYVSSAYAYNTGGTSSLSTVLIDGAGSSWAISGTSKLGENGIGVVTVQNSGNLTITGGDIFLGYYSTGKGTLVVQSQGTVESGNATLGNQAGAIGTATVTGLNSSWTVDGDLTIGDYGTGSLFLNSAAMLTTTGNATLGSQAASTGTATVSDVGTEWQINGELKIGDNGSAKMLVENGAYISLAGNLAIADTAINSTGSLTLDGNGSRIIGNGTSVTIGGQGTGTMAVQNGADAIFSGAGVSLGEKQGGSGTLTVQDNNTLMSVGSLTVGSGGTGIFNLLNSASFSTATSVTLGENATGIGTATIDDATMTDASTLTVGGSGTGTLNIQNGGSLTVQGSSLSIGEQAGSSGTLSLSGGSSALTYSGDITVGSYGSGVFAAQTGGQFTGTSMTLGENSGASGGLNITGAGSSVKLSQDLTVGKQGVGLLTIAGGGILSTQGDVTLASKAGANATLSIDGDSSGLTAPNLNIGGSDSKAGGIASVTLTNAGHLNIAQKLTMWKGSSINTTYGTITVGTTTGAAEEYLTINSTGELAASGTITGNVSNKGGTISIGAGKPGTLSITGNFSQTAGILKVAMGGTSSSEASQLDATGTVAITGGTIEFDFVNGYAPKKGDTFQFIDPPQSVNLSNVNYTFTGLAPGFLFNITPNTSGLAFTALNNAVATPEPAALALFALGGILLLLRRRRTQEPAAW